MLTCTYVILETTVIRLISSLISTLMVQLILYIAKIREKPVMDSNTSIDLLDKEHNRLTQTKIKDSLSSFVPDIPGVYLYSVHVPISLPILFHR